ncbi:uncharacterized protein LOC8281255 [Ricinus communis]|uniref:uncharacterized protein LOC8281255 n=1 Tax=Ricinus communis TaxID=3988 RepID=UPI00201B28ED|nr:uncharacterized protein LOC8281255 [Ricinus communis]
MSFIFSTSPSRITFYYLKNPNISPPPSQPIISCHIRTPSHFGNFRYNLQKKPQNFTLRAYQSDETLYIQQQQQHQQNDYDFNLDSFLSITEFLCFMSSAIITVSYAVNCTVISSKKTVLGLVGSNKAVAWGLVVMVSGMAIGAWIRRRQWLRVCKVTVREGRESVNLVERIEKLEEDLKSSATIIKVLSRQLEKLGIRFRVTRRSLKDPIAETAALAQKNSEATRALAMQEDILEKELGEIQKVLLAMQEQQQKQLELILAVGKSGKLWESRQEPSQQQDVSETSDSVKGAKKMETQETQASAASKGTNNDRP